MDIITILTGILTVCVTIIGFFIKSHIENIEKDVKTISKQVSALIQDGIWITNSLKKMEQSNANNIKETKTMLQSVGVRVQDIKEDIAVIDEKVRSHQKHLEDYGKVIRFISKKN